MTAPIYADLASALQTRGCAVCDHLSAQANDFFAQRQFALFADEVARREFAEQFDLCPLHLWQLEAVSSPTGTSAGHAPLVEHLGRALDRAARNPAERTALASLTPGSSQCRVCQRLHEAEARYLGHLVAFVREPTGRATYAGSHGLCLAHLAMLVAAVADDEAGEFLLSHAARYFEKMAAEMRNYSTKNQALRRDLLTADEHDAYLRALTHIAGRPNLCGAGHPQRAL